MRFAALLLAALAVPGAANAAADARARMERFSSSLHSVSGRFSQTVTDASGRRGDESQGTFALQSPRQFRWQTDAPYQQTIVADGARVWIYEPDLEQVSVRRQSDAEAQSPLTVLTDLSQLDRDFDAKEAGERNGLAWLRLTSKATDPDFEYADLGFDEAVLARMQFRDQLGNLTEIRFSEWKRNPPLAADTFRFTPPDGVDVVGDAPAEPDVYPIEP